MVEPAPGRGLPRVPAFGSMPLGTFMGASGHASFPLIASDQRNPATKRCVLRRRKGVHLPSLQPEIK